MKELIKLYHITTLKFDDDDKYGNRCINSEISNQKEYGYQLRPELIEIVNVGGNVAMLTFEPKSELFVDYVIKIFPIDGDSFTNTSIDVTITLQKRSKYELLPELTKVVNLGKPCMLLVFQYKL